MIPEEHYRGLFRGHSNNFPTHSNLTLLVSKMELIVFNLLRVEVNSLGDLIMQIFTTGELNHFEVLRNQTK